MDISNTILLQWGFPYVTTNTFPITYTKIPSVLAGGEYSWGGQTNMIRDVDIATFTTITSRTDVQRGWLSIGT